VEKPIARSLVDAANMVNAANKSNCILMTVANKRFSPPYRRAKWLVEHGALQNPALFSGKFNLGYDDVELFESGTIHLLDLVGYLMGKVSAVSATGVRRYSNSAYPVDNAAVTLRFASGAVGNLYTSASALSFKPWERVEVYGNHAWLSVEDQNQLILYENEMDGARLWQPVVPNTLLFDEEFGGYMGLIENFAQSIRGAETPLVTGKDGYVAFELLRAVQLAIARGEWVSLPLEPASADEEALRWLAQN
jgi:predicted dehydrogenase